MKIKTRISRSIRSLTAPLEQDLVERAKANMDLVLETQLLIPQNSIDPTHTAKIAKKKKAILKVLSGSLHRDFKIIPKALGSQIHNDLMRFCASDVEKFHGLDPRLVQFPNPI